MVMGMMVIVEGNHITVTIHQVALGSHLSQHFLSVGILLTLMEVLITFPEKEVHHSNFKVNHSILPGVCGRLYNPSYWDGGI